MNWAMVTAVVTALAGASGLLAWMARSLIREELAPVRQDIEVLRVAVFNHLRHGDEPVEGHIREVLGYGERQ